MLVKLGIDANILGSHGLLSETLHLLDGTGGLSLEGGLVHELSKVDGIVAGDEVNSGFTFGGSGRHANNGWF